MVYDVLKTLSSMINEDQTLSMSQNLGLMIQNAELRANAKHDNAEILTELKTQMTAFNEQLKNDNVSNIIEVVEGKLVELQRPNKYKNYQVMLNEYNMNEVVTRIKESESYADPILRGFVDNMATQLGYAKVPHFKYIPVVVEGLKKFESMNNIQEEITIMETYIHENHKNLLVLEAIYEMERLPGKMYNSHIELLKDMLFEKKVSSVRLAAGYSGLIKAPLLDNLIEGLGNVESTETGDNMDVFTGSNNPHVKVNNYIGPVLKEDKSITILIDGNFVTIAESNEDINLDNYTTILENTETCFVGIIRSNRVDEKFISLVNAFSKLPGRYTNEGIVFDFKRFTTEFKLNEDNKLDIYLNSEKLEEGIDEKLITKLSLLRPSEKDNFRLVIENIEQIFSVDFVKSIINERITLDTPGRGLFAIDINENFYVYEITNDMQRKIFKMDDYQFTNYLHESFKIDASNLFKIKLTEKVEALKVLSHKRDDLINEVISLEANINKINEAMKTDLPEKHIETLSNLKEEISGLLIQTNEKLLLCKEDLLKALQPEELNEDNKLSAGDSVKLKDGTIGRVVSTAPSLNSYIILTESGDTRTITNEEIESGLKDEEIEEETPVAEEGEEVVEEAKVNEGDEMGEQPQPSSDGMKPIDAQAQTQTQETADDTQAQTQTQDEEVNPDEILSHEKGVTRVEEGRKWEDVKDKQHDASGIKKPEDYTWTKKDGTYYPDKKEEDKKKD